MFWSCVQSIVTRVSALEEGVAVLQSGLSKSRARAISIQANVTVLQQERRQDNQDLHSAISRLATAELQVRH